MVPILFFATPFSEDGVSQWEALILGRMTSLWRQYFFLRRGFLRMLSLNVGGLAPPIEGRKTITSKNDDFLK